MQKSIISWTQQTWNPVSGCSRVSDGCKFCYAATLSARYGWTELPWTVQNEADNVVLKPHKLKEPYLLKEPTRVFVNSMSDQFHQVIPDWYRAAIFAVMLSLPQHTFQVLTKRVDATVDWHVKFRETVWSNEYTKFTEEVTDKRVKAALKYAADNLPSPWGENIWMGTSVEDSRVLHRIKSLQQCKAQTRFISAEPLIGPWGDGVDLTGIHWVIVGGESGSHMTAGNPRWMKQEWARQIKNACVDQGVAFFYKQDSGLRTELRPWLIEDDGTHWTWEQWPHNLVPPTMLNVHGKPYSFLWIQAPPQDALSTAKAAERAAYQLAVDNIPTHWSVNAAISAAYWYDQARPSNPPVTSQQPASSPAARVVHFNDVKTHWNKETHQWDSPDYVYIGRAMLFFGLQASIWRNPFKLEDQSREYVIESYRRKLGEDGLPGDIKTLAGKTLVCWCKPDDCHGDVLLDLLEKAGYPVERHQHTHAETGTPQPAQLTLF